jgi:hypothetical protein
MRDAFLFATDHSAKGCADWGNLWLRTHVRAWGVIETVTDIDDAAVMADS